MTYVPREVPNPTAGQVLINALINTVGASVKDAGGYVIYSVGDAAYAEVHAALSHVTSALRHQSSKEDMDDEIPGLVELVQECLV